MDGQQFDVLALRLGPPFDRRAAVRPVAGAAPDRGVCTILENRCAGDTTVCGQGIGGDCQCQVTMQGFSLCGNSHYYSPAAGPCASDADCARDGLAGTSCVQSGAQCGDPGSGCALPFCVGPCTHPS